MILYRPVGQAEYDLIAQSGFTAYPPRLPEQPIFYLVLNERYAHLDEKSKQNILKRAHNARSEKNMYFLVASLANGTEL